MITLFTDTDTDITPEVAKYYGYKLISMPYIVNDKEVYPYIDFDAFDDHSFYEMLRKGTLPTTCALNETDYVKYFEDEFKKGNDIFYVHFSRAMSASFANMDLAVEKLKKKYPGRNFYEIDTKGISIGSLNIVLEVGDMFKANKPVEEILKWAETEVDKFAVYFYADDLKFFKRSGRVSGLAAFMGNIIGIHPIIYMNEKGIMTNIGKVKGRMKALAACVDYVKTLGDNIKDHRILIAHSDAMEIANILDKMLKEEFGEDLKTEFVKVNPTAGSHCGPDAIGVSFHSIHR